MFNKLAKNKYMKFFIKISVSGAFVWYLISKVDIEIFYNNIKNYPIVYLWIAFALMIADSLVGAVSLNALYKNESILQIFYVTLKSSVYSLILPGQLLGESSKIIMLSSEKGRLFQRVSAVLVDKVLNLFALLWLGALGIFISTEYEGGIIKLILGGTAVAATLVLLIGTNGYFCSEVENLIRKIPFIKVRKNIEQFFDIWRGYVQDKKAILISIVCGFVYHLIINCIYCLLSTGLLIKISFVDFYWINSLLTIILLLPISIGGLGIREATLVGMLGLLGIEEDMAFSFSILVLILQVMRAFIGGLLILFDNAKWRGKG